MWREARPSSPEAASNAKPRRRDALVPAIRVLLANDRQIILWGLERLIDAQAPRMKVVAKAISNAELLSQTVRHHPDVTLLDLDLDGENTVDLIPSLLRDANARVLILSGSSDKRLLDRAVLNGAHGILHREEPAEAIVKAIEKVCGGELWLDRGSIGSLFTKLSGNTPPDPEARRLEVLTPKELDIVAAVVSHPRARTRELAGMLYMSEHTLRNRLSKIYGKLDVANRLDLFAYASQHGLGRPARTG